MAAAQPSADVAVTPLAGMAEASDARYDLVQGLREHGLAVDALRCRAQPDPPRCARSLRERWSDRSDSYRFMITGSVHALDVGRRVHLEIFERGQPDPVAHFDARFVEGDLVLPIVFPQAVADAVRARVDPPAPASEQELAVLARLDEPARLSEPGRTEPGRTDEPARIGEPERISEPGRIGAPGRTDQTAGSEQPLPRVRLDPGPVLELDTFEGQIGLRRDFAAVCRTGPRQRRRSRDDPRDLRPKCSAGPVLGYVRPRTWVVGTMMVASAIASGVSLGLRRRADFGSSTDQKLGGWGAAMAATSGVLGVAVVTLTIGDRWQARRHLGAQRWLELQETATR